VRTDWLTIRDGSTVAAVDPAAWRTETETTT